MGTKRLLRGVCPFKCALVSLRRSPYVTNGLLPDLEPGREVVERLTRRRVRPRLGGGVACAGGDPAELQQQRAAVSAQAAGYPAASSRPSASSASRSRRRHRLRLIVEPALLSHVNRYFELASTSTSSVQVAAPVSGGEGGATTCGGQGADYCAYKALPTKHTVHIKYYSKLCILRALRMESPK